MINEDIRGLGIEIWAWRASQQQCSGDDIPRLPRSGESQRVSVATSRGHESRQRDGGQNFPRLQLSNIDSSGMRLLGGGKPLMLVHFQ